jgi:glycosyltransferase involved in cell wall biosynthesis
MKILFVTHNVGLGGAARSLRELLGAYDDAECDLAVPVFANLPDDAAIRSFFGPRLRRIFRFWIPWSEVYVGHAKLWQSARSHLLFPVMWRASRAKFARFVRRERYDVVHLNSLVLHPMLSAELPMTLHVREILGEQHARVQADAAAARGVVFIDEATRKPFERRMPRESIVLNNPVDMTKVGTVPANAAARLGGDPAKLTIFAMVGDLNAEKGVPFAIDAFRSVASPDARLVLVGRGARIETLDRRVVFWGEERDIAQIYTLADYVMRGESYPCVGRTIYEALYAGCGVVVPGAREGHGMFEFERFADRIAFYTPRDRGQLVGVLDSMIGHKRLEKHGESNVASYVVEFDRFLRRVIGKA